MVRSPPFQGGGTGSNPVPSTIENDGIREDEFRKDKVTNPCRKRIERVNGTIINSPLAQLEEHLVYIQGVVGSIPTGTTNQRL